MSSQDVRTRLKAELDSGRPAAKKLKDAIDRWIAGDNIYGIEGWHAALLGQLTGDPKYCKAAVDLVNQEVAAEQKAITSAGAPAVADDDYLNIGPMVGDVALVYDWCNQEAGGSRGAWLAYANQAVFNVWNYQKATWNNKTVAWEGWAVDNPSNNYYYSFLRATMLLGLAAHDEIPDAATWLTTFHDAKLTGELVPTFDKDLVGGGSREGTGYGVSMRELFHLYDLWQGSTGEQVFDLTPHTRSSILSFIHQTMPTLDFVAPTGDQSRDSTAAFFDYHRNYLQELIYLFPNDPIAPAAQALLAQSSVPEMDNPFMYVYDFLYDNQNVAPGSLDGLNPTYYAPGIGELYARSGWDKHATWVNMIAGSFTESHAHQDQGSIMIYKDGWLAYDGVVDSQSGLTQATTGHSVVRLLDGTGKVVEQLRDTDPKLVALHQGAGFTYAVADVTPVYGTKSVAQKVQREMLYLQPDVVVVYDRVQTKAGSQVWQLVSPKAPAVSDPTATVTAAGHTLTISKVTGGAMAQTSLAAVDGDNFQGGFRLDETKPAGDNRFLHVIGIDGAASAVTAVGSDGVSFTAGGKAITVQFTPGDVGATLTIDGAATTLGAGVDTIKESQ
ncbi:MAG TPA: hypothetical protein VFP84_24275 [Kofleriaceae bacterium]|nr:hypothetical protein [Kofleriaceae bacterium]